jgi:superfamily II DNA/RNA helicase
MTGSLFCALFRRTPLPYSTFESMCAHLNVHPKLQQAIKALGYKIPTEIQKLAIPEVINGKDLMASAETGAGKTVAFGLPALQRLISNPPIKEGRGPRVLILTPTRELASQITDSIAALSKFANFRFGIITGGVAYHGQERLLAGPFDVLIATPGRLMDHMSYRNRVDFSRLEMFILDEADRMLDMGFKKDIEHIASALPTKRQTLLFSATLEGEVQVVARKFLKDPVCLQLASSTKKHTLISQRVHLVDNWNHKRALLSHILEEADMWQAIVFTATKRGADDLVEELSSQGVVCAALHGDMKQSKRSRTLEQMHRGRLRVLVATDVAARGLDVKKLTHVVNFDLPRTGEDYVHRIGRTGRCGEKGTAISLVGPKDGALLAQIERFTAQKLERQVIPGFEPRTAFNLNPAGARPKSKASPSRRRPSQSNNSERSFHGFGRSAKKPPSFREGDARGKR